MVKLARRAAHIPFAAVVAAMFAGAAAFLTLAAPQVWLDALAQAVALPAAVSNRFLIAPVCALLIGGLTYLVLRPVEVRLGWTRTQSEWEDRGYAPSAPDSPLARRKPIFATDELGAPLMSDAVLELQPGQIVDAPPSESETAAMPPVTSAPTIASRDDDDDAYGYAIDPDDHSIPALIRRLERGMARRAPAGPLHDALGPLVTPLFDSFPDDPGAAAPQVQPAAQQVDENLVRERLNALRRRLGD